MIENIISLKEVSASKWHAQYRGNYGIYTIKIANGDETVKKLLDKYKTLYKNRRAMIEEFNKINYHR